MAQAAFAFELPGDGYRREDFLASDANREALLWIGRWPDWPARGLILSGPEAAGKTHLAHLWAEASGARFIPPEAVGREAPEDLLPLEEGGAAENERVAPRSTRGGEEAERIAPPPPNRASSFRDSRSPAPPSRGSGSWFSPAAAVDGLENIGSEEGLFHLLNHAQHAGGWLLLTSRVPAARLEFRLPDLRSRLNALPAARLDPPDDALLAALLAKQFSDRQLKVGGDVIAWLLPRIERSFAAIKSAAERIDRAALENGRNVTAPFVRELFQIKKL